jgi:hypothetical protein
MLCRSIADGLDLGEDSGVIDESEEFFITYCIKREKDCCDAANKAVDGAGAGA